MRLGREGVSYVFCNIHPEMSAVILALSTPYFAVIEKQENTGDHSRCAAGQYLDCMCGQRARLLKRLDVLTRSGWCYGRGNAVSWTDRIPFPGDLSAHRKNKFGNDYDDEIAPIY